MVFIFWKVRWVSALYTSHVRSFKILDWANKFAETAKFGGLFNPSILETLGAEPSDWLVTTDTVAYTPTEEDKIGQALFTINPVFYEKLAGARHVFEPELRMISIGRRSGISTCRN